MSSDKSNSNLEQGGGRMRRTGKAGFAFLAQSLQQISTLVITLLAARFLLPAEYGVYAIAIVFTLLIEALTYTGYYHFIVTSKEDDARVLSTGFWMMTGIATAAAVVLALTAKPIAWIFGSDDLAPVLLLLAAIQPIAGASAWYSAALLRRQAVNMHFTVMFFQSLAALVGGALLLWLWQSLYALVAFRYLRVFSGVLLYLFLSPDRPGWAFDGALARRGSRFAGGLYGARFMNFLSRYSGDLLLGLMFSTAEAGLYRFGSRIAGSAVEVVSAPMRSFTMTQMAAAGRAGDDLSDLLERFAGSTMILTGGIAATVIVFAPDVIASIFNPAYMAAVGVTYAVAAASTVRLGATLLESTLSVKHRTGLLMRFNTVSMLLTIATVFAAAPFGLYVLGWSIAAMALVRNVSALWIIRGVGIRIAGAVRALLVGLTLVIAYGAALAWVWSILRNAVTNDFIALGIGLAVAALFGGIVILVGWKLRVFTLRVFSG